ncbi:MAG: alcohol dehydrogenase catalytic domain-containing protein [Bauldia sp.]
MTAKQTQALVLHGLGQMPRLEDVVVSDPGPGEVRIRVMAAGICHTDLGYVEYARATPVVLGHEGAGIVEAVGTGVSASRVGEHVVISWRSPCGECRNCRSGRAQFCESVRGTAEPRVYLGDAPLAVMLNVGCFAAYVVVPAASAVAIRADMPFAKAALLGCAVATGLGAAIRHAKINDGDDVAVIGCGGVGLNTVQGARLARAGRIIAIDRDPDRLALARSFGATDEILASGDIVAEVRKLTDGRGVDHAFELVGRPDLIEAGAAMLARGGQLTLVGATGREEAISLRPRGFMSQQQRICGCIYGDIAPGHDLALFADWYADGRLQLDPLHTATISLAEMPDHFSASRHSGIRTVVRFED